MLQPIFNDNAPDCANGNAPHDFQVEDFSDGDGGQADVKCRKCGTTNNSETTRTVDAIHGAGDEKEANN